MLVLVQSHQVAEFDIVERVILSIEAPEVAAHVSQGVEVGVLSQLELLLKIDNLLSRLDLQQLSLRHLNDDPVTVGPSDVELFVKYLD